MGRKIIRIWFFVLMMIACQATSLAQYYIRGQDPASIRWKQIHTEHFRLIFPEDYEERATYVADLLEFIHEPASASLGHRPRKVPVILHNQTVEPNGFVSWAPARLEMFTNPPPNDDVHDWIERLAIHEYRHVVQIDKLNQGITRVLSILFGQQATGAVLGLGMPPWLLEGDAVAAETAFTFGGRGRNPRFEQGLRAQVMERGAYSYDKAMLGSYRDHVPNHYEFGYQLVAAARHFHGAKIWDDVINNIAKRPYTIFPLSLGLKKQTGLNVSTFYESTFQWLDSAWTAQQEQHSYTEYKQISAEQKLHTNYRSLAFLNDTDLLALKTGMQDIPRVVRIQPDGTETVLFTPGFYNSEIFSFAAGKIVWTEHRNDPRWEHRSWSEVHMFCLQEHTRTRVTRNTRYFSPALSPDGQAIAVTEVSSTNDYWLVLIDAQTGEQTGKYATAENAFLMQPQWHPDGKTIIAIARDETGKRIVSLEPEHGVFSTLFHAGHTEIARPRYLDAQKVAFTGAFPGISNIYLLNKEKDEVFQLVSSRYGALDAVLSPDGQTLAWSDYRASGYRAVQRTGGLSAFMPLTEVEDHSVGFHQTLAEQEGLVVTERVVPRKEHDVTKYRKGLNLFNIHSWGPFTLNVDTREAEPGFSLFSQNPLSTSVAELGYAYDLNEELGRFFLNYSYYGLYPVLDLRAETGLRRSFYRPQQNPDERIPFLWREYEASLGVRIPLQFRKGPVFYGITPSIRPGITQVAGTADSPDFFLDNAFYTMSYRLTGYRQLRSVVRDLGPRSAQVVDLNYRHTPFGGTDMGSVLSGRLIWYFPGLIRHHSLRLSAAYQQQEEGTPKEQSINYIFPNLINYPRGISGRYDKRTYSFSADYAFPVAYPDWALSSLVYIKRISLNLFADYAQATSRVVPPEEEEDPFDDTDNLQSFGADILNDVHLLRFFAPVTLGLRTIYLPETDDFEFRLLFVLDL